MGSQKYGISAHDYLARARAQLDREEPQGLFYAAFELRCGIEQRMREFLEAQEHVSEKKKEGWRITNLGRTIEDAFGIGDTVLKFAVMERSTRELIGTFYYTPVSSDLQSMGGRLGNYTHAQLFFRDTDDPWWDETRSFLETVYAELYRSCQGSLLGPPLISPEGKIRMPVELNAQASRIAEIGEGGEFTVDVRYLDNYPESLK